VPGQLHIGGIGVAAGYLNRPELTVERFIPSPFAENGGRLYRTGDLGRFLPDGHIEYLGRIDHQVKIRGVRIELGEIEAVLGGHPQVRQCVVVLREDQPGTPRLAAYLLGIEPVPAPGELADYLAARLPGPMVPALYVPVDAFPLTPSGKIDRAALPAPGAPGEPDADLPAAYERIHTHLRARLDLADGALLQAALLRLGGAQGQRLLLVAHHLVVDGMSWRILLQDLIGAQAQLAQGGPLRLPPKTTAYADWAAHLAERAAGADLRAELDHWLALPWARLGPQPFAALEAGTERGVLRAASGLDEARTAVLLERAIEAYHLRVDDLLLAALALAARERLGTSGLLVDLEGHGRVPLAADLDLSRTVGWFTSIHPVILECRDPADPGALLRTVKEALRTAQDGGLGYGLLRYLASDAEVRERVAALPRAGVLFNYLGRFAELPPEIRDWAIDAPFLERRLAGSGQASHPLEVNAAIVDGRLRLQWALATAAGDQEALTALVRAYDQALERLIEHCLDPSAGGYTPCDFPDAGLDQDVLDGLLEGI
jgi:non-ribosomal peptide synthase protein (TIGR01720 family)